MAGDVEGERSRSAQVHPVERRFQAEGGNGLVEVRIRAEAAQARRQNPPQIHGRLEIEVTAN